MQARTGHRLLQAHVHNDGAQFADGLREKAHTAAFVQAPPLVLLVVRLGCRLLLGLHAEEQSPTTGCREGHIALPRCRFARQHSAAGHLRDGHRSFWFLGVCTNNIYERMRRRRRERGERERGGERGGEGKQRANGKMKLESYPPHSPTDGSGKHVRVHDTRCRCRPVLVLQPSVHAPGGLVTGAMPSSPSLSDSLPKGSGAATRFRVTSATDSTVVVSGVPTRCRLTEALPGCSIREKLAAAEDKPLDEVDAAWGTAVATAVEANAAAGGGGLYSARLEGGPASAYREQMGASGPMVIPSACQIFH